jgi:acid phosphatase family membrane protein YuiD
MYDPLTNHVLIAVLTAWLLAQSLKVPIFYLQKHRWNWALMFSTGGMPSSHSALIVSAAASIGFNVGLNSPLFALAVAIAMVIVYDATGIRRQAGLHAQKINILIDELLKGHPISDKQLKEVLGHSPLEVLGGVVLGIAVAFVMWRFWH